MPVTARLCRLLAIATLAAGVLMASGCDRRTVQTREPRPAEALIDSIGVNVHFGYGDTAYANQAAVLARLDDLGVRHFRDAAPDGNPLLATGLAAAGRQELRGTLIAGPAGDPDAAVAGAQLLMGDAVEAVEGPNEVDKSSDPQWALKLRDYMPRLEGALDQRAPETLLVGPSFIEASSRLEVAAELPGLFNAHPYAGGDPPERALIEGLSDPVARDRGAVFTEAGYHNALSAAGFHTPVSEQAAAVYLPRVLVAAFAAGVKRTFIYELLDGKPEPGLNDPEQHFGLLRNDLTAKPAFTAVKTLIRAVRGSPGAPVTDAPSWDFAADADPPVAHVTLDRRDGSRVIALWRPVSVWDAAERRSVDPGPLPVELVLEGSEATDIEVWRPSLSTVPVERRARASRMSLVLGGDLMLVSLR